MVMFRRLLLCSPLLVLVGLAWGDDAATEGKVIEDADNGQTVVLRPDGTYLVKTVTPETAEPVELGADIPVSLAVVPDVVRPLNKLPKKHPADHGFVIRDDGRTAFGFLVHDSQPIPPEALKSAALENARRGNATAEITAEQTRLVNGTEGVALTIRRTSGVTKQIIHGHYFTGKFGAVQLTTVTDADSFEAMKPVLEKFLNGITIER